MTTHNYCIHMQVVCLGADNSPHTEAAHTQTLQVRQVHGKQWIARNITPGRYLGYMAVGDSKEEAIGRHLMAWMRLDFMDEDESMKEENNADSSTVG